MMNKEKNCDKCWSDMVEIPLFTSTYWECPKCDHPEKERDKPEDDISIGFMGFGPLLEDGEGIPSDLNSHINHGWYPKT